MDGAASLYIFSFFSPCKVTAVASGFSKSLAAFTRNPLAFVWASFIYLVMLAVFICAAVGIFIIYFIGASVLNQPILNPGPTVPTIILGIFIGVLLLFSMSGLNGALARSYREAMNGRKTSMAAFFATALSCARGVFVIQLIRDIIWLVLVGPALAIFVLYFSNTEYMDIIIGTYAFFMTFVIHLIFTPALVAFGVGIETKVVGAFKRIPRTLRANPILFVGTYILFAFVWLLNFVPVIDFFTVFAVFPILYTALIATIES